MYGSWKPRCRDWREVTRAGRVPLNTSKAVRRDTTCIEAERSRHDDSCVAGSGCRLGVASCCQPSLAGDPVFCGRLVDGEPLETGTGPAALRRLAPFPR